ncbi:hypothetical protein, partial [Streptomyces sp. KR55]|uniref:hypothetical protein n=1 Tax=Streptomyces sp. KR55 TaxID=3457425 RepID=UPI003FD5E02B
QKFSITIGKITWALGWKLPGLCRRSPSLISWARTRRRRGGAGSPHHFHGRRERHVLAEEGGADADPDVCEGRVIAVHRTQAWVSVSSPRLRKST